MKKLKPAHTLTALDIIYADRWHDAHSFRFRSKFIQ